MRYMFTIFCKDKEHVLKLLNKLPQINIKKILLIRPERNTTGEHSDCKYIINVYCEIQVKIDYMAEAIKKYLTPENYLQYYSCQYYEKINKDVYRLV